MKKGPNTTEILKEHVKMLTPSKGKKTNNYQTNTETIVSSCTCDGANDVRSVYHYLNVNNQYYEHEGEREKKKRKDYTKHIADFCVNQFMCSEVANQIDANTFKFKPSTTSNIIFQFVAPA